MDPIFLIAATAMALGAAAIVLLGLRQRTRPTTSRAALNAAVLRQRIGELAREREQGLISAEEFAAAREELQRRALVEAIADPDAPAAARGRGALVLAAVALPLLALPIYLEFGSPHLAGRGPAPQAVGSGAEDRAATPAAAPQAAMLAVLEAHVASTPKDARAWVLLGRARMEANQFGPAAFAYERAIAVAPKVARDPAVWCEYADAVGMSQGGSLVGKPRELIGKALEFDAEAPCALEMAGSAAVEVRDFRAAQDYWSRLLRQLPAESPQHLQLATALKRIELQSKFALPSS